MKAVAAAFIEIKTVKFTKKVKLSQNNILFLTSLWDEIVQSWLATQLPSALRCKSIHILKTLSARAASYDKDLTSAGDVKTQSSYSGSDDVDWPVLVLCLYIFSNFVFRDLACFNYFCRACWELQHGDGLPHHRPIMRNTRGGGNMDR